MRIAAWGARRAGSGLALTSAGLLAAALTLASARSAAAAATLTECRLPGLAHAVLCGVVERPLAPPGGQAPAALQAPPQAAQAAASTPGEATLSIHYVVVPALARRKLPDPVFLLAGGPGQSAIGAAPQLLPLFSRLNNRRDIVFVDQRGTGRSAPLDCPQRSDAPDADMNTDQQVAQLLACQATLLKRPYLRTSADLGHFTTTLAMHDLDAVRAQLGAARINLVGISYGTRAALEYMRLYPQAVRRSVLDAVAPPDMALPASMSTDAQAAWDGWLNFCERDAACHADHPGLRGSWAALLRSLPKTLTVTAPPSGLPQRLRLTRDTLLAAVRGALYTPAVAAALPAALDAAAAGRWEALLGLGALQRPRPELQPALGMHFSVVCAEDMNMDMNKAMAAPETANAPGSDFGSTGSALYQRVCARWPRGAVPAAFYKIASTTTPTLLFSGGLDPATPPRHGARVAQALGGAAQHVVVANAGHGVLGIGCARDVVFRFIDAVDDHAATAVDASCLNSIPHPPAFAPARAPIRSAP